MRLRFFISGFLVFGVLLIGCSSKDRTKTEKLSMPAFSSTIVPSFSVDPNILQRISIDAIRGTHPEEIQVLIRQFPFGDYKMIGVYSGFEVEYFCIDSFTDYIKNELRAGHAWEGFMSPYILKYCRPGSLAVDVGAHIGTHTIQLSRAVGEKGKVLAIEPQPKSLQELVVNMALNQANNIEFFWGAAGSQHSNIELNPLSAENEGAAGLGSGGTGQFVEVIPLDSLQLQNVSLIKIDVEGMEIDVLRGAKETILRDHPVLLIEIMGGAQPETASNETKQEILSRIRFVEEMGYEVIRINWQWDYLALPKNSSAFEEIKNTKIYRDNMKYFHRGTSTISI